MPAGNIQVKRAFKSYSFVTKKFNKKNRQALNEIYFIPNASIQRCLYSLFQNQCTLFLLPLFFEEYLNLQVMINKMVNESTVDYHPTL